MRRYDANLATWRQPDGTTGGVLVTARDVTESDAALPRRRRADAEARALPPRCGRWWRTRAKKCGRVPELP